MTNQNPQVQVNQEQPKIIQVLEQLKTDLEKYKIRISWNEKGEIVDIHVPVRNTKIHVSARYWEVERRGIKMSYTCVNEWFTIRVDNAIYSFHGVVASLRNSTTYKGEYFIDIIKHRDNYDIIKY